MDKNRHLAERFEANRPHLRAVAYRMLGTVDDVDDAVQETWLRLQSVDVEEIENLDGWLTTVISRICLNGLRARKRRVGESDATSTRTNEAVAIAPTPDEQAVLADSLGRALLIVLDMLTPAERICFVLHDTFAFAFEEISAIVDKSPEACRQLASRARRRVRISADSPTDPSRQQAIVGAFLHAAQTGDLHALIALLHPDVTLVADAAGVAMGAPARRTGPTEVASTFSGQARGARVALLDGRAGLVWSRGATLRVAFEFTVIADTISAIEMIADPEVLAEIDVAVVARR